MQLIAFVVLSLKVMSVFLAVASPFAGIGVFIYSALEQGMLSGDSIINGFVIFIQYLLASFAAAVSAFSLEEFTGLKDIDSDGND